jgi:acyl-CoA dehydrogenase
VDVESCCVEHGVNIAGEPRDTLHLDRARIVAGRCDPSTIRRRGALARACAMAGALEGMLEATALWVMQREQFGRPIGRFQAVQHQVAELAGEVAAASVAVKAAVLAEESNPAPHAVAAAKVRVGEAGGIASAIAHQLHGAIGVTDEHDLHRLSRRVWAWRDEFGGENEWARALGERVIEVGESGLWPLMTSLA